VVHSASYPIGIKDTLTLVNMPEREAGQSPPSNA
jgi:hypothetical protein